MKADLVRGKKPEKLTQNQSLIEEEWENLIVIHAAMKVIRIK